MSPQNLTLEDKYTIESGRVYLNGVQALVRLPLMQRRLDHARGLNTAMFISGYRGSPLAGYDLALMAAKKHLAAENILFSPGLNEDLAATAVWGTQQLHLAHQPGQPGPRYDGVTGIWYGKGPGVDRSIDAIKHANAAGTAAHGGVLALAGDDHACKSSTFPHQSEQAFVHSFIPILHPAHIADVIEMGLHGIALSRYSGCWVALKIVSDVADSTMSVISDPSFLQFQTPSDFALPPDGLNIRWYDVPAAQEERLLRWRLPAAQAYVRANGLDKRTIDPVRKRLAIVTAGKAWGDTMQALADLGLSISQVAEMGICVYKLALTWPLEESGILRLAQEVEQILVVEEKRPLIEDQIKKILYHLEPMHRPRVVGKSDQVGAPLLPAVYELTPLIIAEALVRCFSPLSGSIYAERLAVRARQAQWKGQPSPTPRVPWYCSGCPHNTSTVVPDGSRALAGIGCHYMAIWMDRGTVMFSQMGGEGVPWIGQAPFTDERHIFANLGDGTYFHSGLLAIRAAVAAKVNITYKILYNDAVAMTGGQHVDGDLSPEAVAWQVHAEGVQKIFLVSDAPEKYHVASLPSGLEVAHRDRLAEVQESLKVTPGTTVLIYDQTCAAEKRRRRKRGLMPDPAQRVLINERVCEGCGDCGVQSNCLSIVPVNTDFGVKRQIDQSSCNKDFSCLKGFCPSFVTVRGGRLRPPAVQEIDASASPELDEPQHPLSAHILVTGIGGTGVVTVGAILGMAAHLEGKACSILDQTGLAQKGGSVSSHVRIATDAAEIPTARISSGGATLILGGDLLVTAEGDSLARIQKGVTKVVLNTHESPTGAFTRNPDWKIPGVTLRARIEEVCGAEHMLPLEATRLATALLGDAVATNMFLLGYAYQKGLIPVSAAAIAEALALNGAAVKMNQNAFVWGRRAALNIEEVEQKAKPRVHIPISAPKLEDIVQQRVTDLTAYQNTRYARRYQKVVEKARAIDISVKGDPGILTETVARSFYKLMAYKDEYEVARLYTDGTFRQKIRNEFEGDYKLTFHLAPPLLARRDDKGRLQKQEFGAWVLPMFYILARLRILRGTPLDLFGYTAERKTERRLIDEYEKTIDQILPCLNVQNYAQIVKIAALPEQIRGYGHVKEKSIAQVRVLRENLIREI